MNKTPEQIKTEMIELREASARLKRVEKLKKQLDIFKGKMEKQNPVITLAYLIENSQFNLEYSRIDGLFEFLLDRHYTPSDITFRNLKSKQIPITLISVQQIKDLIALTGITPKNITFKELDDWDAEFNNFGDKTCCVCLEEKPEIYFCKGTKKVENKYEECCQCNIDLCDICIRKINKCPTCRAGYTHLKYIRNH